MSIRDNANPAQECRKDRTAPSRVELLRWRLSYARKGIRTSPADAARKKPHLKGWQELATTDPRRIHAESNGASPPFDAILRPTGSRDRVMVVDEDVAGELERLEHELGIQLRGTTTEVTTPSGRPHLHFSLPEGVEVSGSVGKNVKDAYVGLDIRGRGNQVLLPPSPGYSFSNGLPMIEAHPKLIEWAQGRKKPAPIVQEKARRTEIHGPGEFVPKHSRNAAMVSFLGRKHDGTRSMGDLIAEGLAYRDTCFGEPESYTDAQIVREARWTFGKEPCRPRRKGREPDPEVEEALEACSRYWYAERLPGGGRSKLRDVYRACLMSAARRSEIGEAVTEDGEVLTGPMFSDSCRQLAEVAVTSAMGASRNLNRLVGLGALAKVEAPKGLAPTFVLITPNGVAETTPRTSDTPPHQPPSSPIGKRLVRGVSLVRADELTTPFYGWRSPVGNSRSGALAALEASGNMTEEELAGALGHARVRDLKRRLLRPLEEMGLVENNGGEWGVVGGYAAASGAAWRDPYATVSRRRVRTRTVEGRVVTSVEESVTVASDAERVEAMREKHRMDRERFAELRRKYAERAEEELCQEEEIRDLLNAWDDEREGLAAPRADGPVGELEPVEGVADAPDTAPVVAEASAPVRGPLEAPERPVVYGYTGDAQGMHTERPDVEASHYRQTTGSLPEDGDLWDLTRALGEFLGRNPGRSNETPSWLAVTLWAYDMVEEKPDEMEVANAMGRLELIGTKEAA